MQIDRTNYEVFFLDYIDGNLSVDLIDQFLDFLEKNPELKEELRSVMKNPVKLPDEKVCYDGKQDLTKSELAGSSDFDYRSIAFMEGDMTGTERDAFELELEGNPKKQRIFSLFERLKLEPDYTVACHEKKTLIRKNSRKSAWLWVAPLAAILIIALALPFLFRTGQQQPAESSAPELSLSQPKPADATNRLSPIQSEPSPAHPTEPAPPVKAVRSLRAGLQTAQAETRNIPSANEQEPGKAMAFLEPISPGQVQLRMLRAETKLQTEDHQPKAPQKYTKFTDYLARRVLDVSKAEEVDLGTFAKAGLQAAEHLSKNKFNIEKNKEGVIREISYNSVLFSFSIPLKKNR